MRPMSKPKVLLGLIGIVFLIWGIGIATRIWANPIFAPFFIISNSLADGLSYVASGIGGFLLALTVIIYYQNSNRRLAKNSLFASSQTIYPMSKALALLGLCGIGFLVWSIGIPIHLWANPIFASFFILSNNVAKALSYAGTGFGALLLALALMFYFQNTDRKISKNNVATALQTIRPMSKSTILLGFLGLIFSVWGIGISTRIWANPMFSVFNVVSNEVADALSYVASGIGGLLLASSVIVYYQNVYRRTGKILKAEPSHSTRFGSAELYDNAWQEKLFQQTESDNDEHNPFVIISGRRTNLGYEEMEKIIE
jgi:hypothetical protein